MKKYIAPIAVWFAFVAVAIVLWLLLDEIFYLFNFLYIGTAVAAGLALFIAGWKYARVAVQLVVGLYMLVYLGIICRENMQIEGFWYYLFSGTFQAAVIHYLVAKIGGPILFGRGWCGYACWTAMLLDFLPYKTPQNHTRKKKLGMVRYVLFIISLTFVVSLFYFKVPNLEMKMFVAFIVGNILYYAVGITMAFVMRDNRAFCKYICPITVFLKPMSYFSLLRMKVDKDKCNNCKQCVKVCPMDVDVLDNKRSRTNATECILCGECSKVCHKKAIKML